MFWVGAMLLLPIDEPSRQGKNPLVGVVTVAVAVAAAGLDDTDVDPLGDGGVALPWRGRRGKGEWPCVNPG